MHSNQNKPKILEALDMVAQILPAPVAWLDTDSVVIGVNDRGLKAIGSTREAYVGKTLYEIYPREMANHIKKHDQEVIQTGKILGQEESVTNVATGKVQYFYALKAPLWDENKKVIGLVVTAIDITEKVELQKNLVTAKKAAQAANKAKSEFIANISHDIRTPLTGILGLAQEFYDTATTPTMKNDAKTLINATHELLSLLNEIIDVVGLESGHMKVKEEDFSLRELLAHNIDLLNPAIKHKKLSISASIDDSIPDYLYGNRRYLGRILLNICSNAIKFTDKGGVKLTVKKRSQKDDQIRLTFSISDTGIGIPKNKQQQIFQHFSRLNPSYQGIYKGSGLGLYTVKQYLRTMHGRVSVTSEEGKGSCFTIHVTFAVSKQPPPQTPSPTPVSTEQLTENKNISILIVEDSLLALRMLQQMLQKLNCHIDTVTTGEEALDVASTHDYDLVFMDVGLPGIDGFETAKRIRHLDDKFKAQVPIIALTAHLSNQVREKCISAGMQETLTKPITVNTMHQILEKYLVASIQPFSKSPVVESKQDNLLTIDLNEGINIGGGDIIFAKKMLAMFVENLPGDLSQIESAHNKKDFATLDKLIHKIYGGLCYCGIPKLRNLVGLLQIALKENHLDKVDELMQMIMQECREVVRTWQSMKDI